MKNVPAGIAIEIIAAVAQHHDADERDEQRTWSPTRRRDRRRADAGDAQVPEESDPSLSDGDGALNATRNGKGAGHEALRRHLRAAPVRASGRSQRRRRASAAGAEWNQQSRDCDMECLQNVMETQSRRQFGLLKIQILKFFVLFFRMTHGFSELPPSALFLGDRQ